MGKYFKISPPKRGSKITVAKNGQLQVPDDPIVPFIQGDGIGSDTWKASQLVFESAVDRCYGNAKRLEWLEVFAGERGNSVYGPNSWLPEDTIRAIQEYKVCIKGPLTTPVGISRPLDSTLRERLDLSARVQAVRHLEGVPTPLQDPQGLDMVIFQEHTEDVCSEIEWKKGSPEAKQVINFINNDMGKKVERPIRPDSSIGIKPISATATKRVIRMALEYAIKHKRRSVTFVHKGNRMKLTEGSFRDWGFELAKKEFGDYISTERQVEEDPTGAATRGRVLVRDRLADQMFRQLLLQPGEYDVIATTNLNGDYLASMTRAMVGDYGIAPTAYVGAKAAIFEASATAGPRYGDEDPVSASSVLLAGEMLFEHLGWKDAAELVANSLMKTIADGTVTSDLARQVDGARILETGEFCERIVLNFDEVRKSRVRQAMKRAGSRF